MAGTLCASLNGGLVARDQGTLIAKTTGGGPPPVTACVDQICDNGWPSMQLTVFDADYDLEGPNITWCGESWSPTEIRAGETKCACPTSYSKSRQTYTLGGPTTLKYTANHRWFRSDLQLQRQYNVSYLTFGLWAAPPFGGNFNNLSVLGTQTDRKEWSGSQVTRFSVAGFPNASTTKSEIGLIVGATPVASPTYNGYSITDAFFGSHIISGVTYTWQKGKDWP